MALLAGNQSVVEAPRVELGLSNNVVPWGSRAEDSSCWKNEVKFERVVTPERTEDLSPKPEFELTSEAAPRVNLTEVLFVALVFPDLMLAVSLWP